MTDNGAVFTSDEFEGFLKTNGVTHTHTALYHPASNGLASVKYIEKGMLHVHRNMLFNKNKHTKAVYLEKKNYTSKTLMVDGKLFLEHIENRQLFIQVYEQVIKKSRAPN